MLSLVTDARGHGVKRSGVEKGLPEDSRCLRPRNVIPQSIWGVDPCLTTEGLSFSSVCSQKVGLTDDVQDKEAVTDYQCISIQARGCFSCAPKLIKRHVGQNMSIFFITHFPMMQSQPKVSIWPRHLWVTFSPPSSEEMLESVSRRKHTVCIFICVYVCKNIEIYFGSVSSYLQR